MRIAYDHTIFTVQDVGGVSRYFARLAVAIAQQGHHTRIVAPLHINQYLKSLPPHLVSGMGVRKYPKPLKHFLRRLNENISPWRVARFKPDVLHETYYTDDFVQAKGAPRVVTIHDMTPELFPHLFKKAALVTQRKRMAVARADHVICVSHNTRADLMKLFEVPESKITVVHHGFDRLQPVSARPASLPDRPYFLFVGGRLPYRNFKSMLAAFAASAKLTKTHAILAIGGGKFSVDEIDVIRGLGLSASHVRQSGATDGDLAAAYAGAAALVFPSHYEGFGFPPLEAMAMKCPVICARSSCLPEIAGESAAYFDPTDVEAIRTAMERVVSDSAWRHRLISDGLQREKLFDWDRCAQSTIQVYKNLTA